MGRCVRVRVRGSVQGVGFRYATLRKARELGARGYVMNRPDGSVEAVFEGDPSIVERCLAFVREGPSGARVSEVETETLPAGELPEFEIRY